MSTNFNIKTFGLNVIPNTKTSAKIAAHSVEKALGNLWEPVLDYLATNDNVFTGDVTKKINKMEFQAMQFSSVMNANKEEHDFDMNF